MLAGCWPIPFWQSTQEHIQEWVCLTCAEKWFSCLCELQYSDVHARTTIVPEYLVQNHQITDMSYHLSISAFAAHFIKALKCLYRDGGSQLRMIFLQDNACYVQYAKSVPVTTNCCEISKGSRRGSNLRTLWDQEKSEMNILHELLKLNADHMCAIWIIDVCDHGAAPEYWKPWGTDIVLLTHN